MSEELTLVENRQPGERGRPSEAPGFRSLAPEIHAAGRKRLTWLALLYSATYTAAVASDLSLRGQEVEAARERSTAGVMPFRPEHVTPDDRRCVEEGTDDAPAYVEKQEQCAGGQGDPDCRAANDHEWRARAQLRAA